MTINHRAVMRLLTGLLPISAWQGPIRGPVLVRRVMMR
jgi:hypothetical protein